MRIFHWWVRINDKTCAMITIRSVFCRIHAPSDSDLLVTIIINAFVRIASLDITVKTEFHIPIVEWAIGTGRLKSKSS